MATGYDMVSFFAIPKPRRLAHPKNLILQIQIQKRGAPNRKISLLLNGSFL